MLEENKVTQTPARVLSPEDANMLESASRRAQELVMEHTHREMDRALLTQLTVQVQEMVVTLEKTNGARKFQETAEIGMLRVSMLKLIGDLQFYGVLPSNLHVAHGQVIRHL